MALCFAGGPSAPILWTVVSDRIAFVDYFTGPYLSLSLFYLLPISIVAWFTNRWSALWLCVITGSFWLFNQLMIAFLTRHGLFPSPGQPTEMP